MKIYIAGKITGFPDYKKKFDTAEERLIKEGHRIMNPTVLPEGFTWVEYMQICYPMLDVCEGIYMLNNWKESKGAIIEFHRAVSLGKKIYYE